MGKRWTEEEDRTLRDMRRAGVSYKECGKVLSRTTQACQQRGFALGIIKKGSDSLPIDLPVYNDTNTEVVETFAWDVKPTWWRRALRKFMGG